jgi:hypothetical protein
VQAIICTITALPTGPSWEKNQVNMKQEREWPKAGLDVMVKRKISALLRIDPWVTSL